MIKRHVDEELKMNVDIGQIEEKLQYHQYDLIATYKVSYFYYV